MAKERTIKNIMLSGNVLCLDFINTVHDRTEEPLRDYLTSYEDWVAWVGKAGVLPDDRVAEIRNLSDDHTQKSEKFLEHIKNLRKLLYRLFLSIAKNGICDEDDLKEFNALLPSVFSSLELKLVDGKPVADWKQDPVNPEKPLWIVIKSAYDLLTEADFNRIKECDKCGWLYFDKSKNNSRRWCSMKTCGSIHKATRYYYRRKKEGKTENRL